MKVIVAVFSFIAAFVAAFMIWVHYPQYEIQQVKKNEQTTLASEREDTYLDYFHEAEKPALLHVAIGDSVINGFGVDPQENLVKIFTEDLEASVRKEVQFHNEGINEITSAELLALVQAGEFDEQLKQADIITINVGGNDILKQGFEEGFYETVRSFDSLQEEFSGNLSGILERIHMLNPEATVLLLELYNPLDPETELSKLADRFLPKWNLHLYALASKFDYAVVVDTTAVINSEKPHYLSADGIHPNERGYHAIADQMLHQLKKKAR